MKQIIRAFLYLFAMLLAGCADVPDQGHVYTDPIVSSVSLAQKDLTAAIPTLDLAVNLGMKPLDAGMTTADREVHSAQKELVAVPAYVTKVNGVINKAAAAITKQNTVISKQARRIALDDCFVAGVLAIVGIGLFVEFGAPLLKFLAL